MKKVIVTGANGFIGSSLVKRLIENNIKVISIVRNRYSNCELLPQSKNNKIVYCDLSEIENLKNLIKDRDIDVFYHLAWEGVNGKEKANQAIQLKNIEITLNCAMVAKEIECKKFICSGTIAEQQVNSLKYLNNVNGGTMYGISKHCSHLLLETYCKTIGLDFVWMQFSNIYGKDNKTGNLISYTIKALENGNEAKFGPALQYYDFIYIEDLIEVVLLLGEKKNNHNFYFIGTGNPRLLKDYLLEIGKQYNKSELIKIGARQDDGIKYSLDMFNNNSLLFDIGDFTFTKFREGLEYIKGELNDK